MLADDPDYSHFSYQDDQQSKQTKKKDLKIGVICAVIVLLVAAIAVVILVIYNKNHQTKTESNTVSSITEQENSGYTGIPAESNSSEAEVPSESISTTEADDSESQETVTPQETQSQNNVEWKQLYKDYLDTYRTQHSDIYSSYGNDFTYSLIYVDNDDIPELVIALPTTRYMTTLCWISNDAVKDTQLSWASGEVDYGVKYIEKSGLIRSREAWQGAGGETIFNLSDGKLVEVAHGTFDEGFNYTYEWNDTSVTKEEYYDSVNQVFDVSKSQDAMQNALIYVQLLSALE